MTSWISSRQPGFAGKHQPVGRFVLPGLRQPGRPGWRTPGGSSIRRLFSPDKIEMTIALNHLNYFL